MIDVNKLNTKLKRLLTKDKSGLTIRTIAADVKYSLIYKHNTSDFKKISIYIDEELKKYQFNNVDLFKDSLNYREYEKIKNQLNINHDDFKIIINDYIKKLIFERIKSSFNVNDN